jgi:hypothetical protein
MLRKRFIRTTIGTIFVHTVILPSRLLISLLSHDAPCDVLVMCCVAPFVVVPRASDTSIGVLGFATRSMSREELQSHLIYVYNLCTWEGEP